MPEDLTREALIEFFRQCEARLGGPLPEPLILSHPRDLEATKRMFGQ